MVATRWKSHGKEINLILKVETSCYGKYCKMTEKKMTYKDAGVDIHAGYKSVELIKKHIAKTVTSGVMSGIGGFGGLFSIDKDKYDEPVLVSGTDGVGTKLMIAFMADKHNTIGEDCVAMCVNDVLCQGARPLFFLDYIATGKLKPEHVASIVEGVANGCVKAKAALIGGETAEMPGLYNEGEYDVAGFSVGIVDKKNIIDGSKVQEGDVLIGLPSNGLHSNGFSLVRKVFFDHRNYTIDHRFEELESTLSEELLKPTRIYIDPVADLNDKFDIHGLSHITGGGFYENIPRMLPDGLRANIDVTKIRKQAIFTILQREGNIDTKEMYSTFNMGVGMIMAVAKEQADNILQFMDDRNEEIFVLGEIRKGEKGVDINHDFTC